MPFKKSILALIIAFAVFASLAPTRVQGANITEVTHSPDNPKSGETVEITLRFDNATNITNIKMIYCTIEPFVCEKPVDMVQGTSDLNAFTYDITKQYAPGTMIGFKFEITYQDSNTQKAPESQSDSYPHQVGGPYEGIYYFTYSVAGEFPILYVVISVVVLVIAVAAILVFMRKRKGRKHENEK